MHIEKVMNKMEQAQLDELARVDEANYKTQDQKITFLQRLELQEKDKADFHHSKIELKNQRWSEVKDRQGEDKKRFLRKRGIVEKKE